MKSGEKDSLNSYKITKRIRRFWSLNPKTRVKGNDKDYDRNKDKSLVRKLIKEGYRED